ncbi:MAG: metallophosphoesterase family protein [Janthinobacterium lividum]
MKFIHAADIHLDSPLLGLSAYQDAPADLLRMATRDAFDKLVSEAIAQQVDFMVIAGDLYDGGWKDFNTGIFFVRQMGRLKQAGIPVYLLLGNHDAENDMTRKLALPDNVHRFPTNKAATFTLPDLRVALHGRSFKEAVTTENLALTYPAPIPGWLNIGVLHTALEGNAAHPNYAPCSIAELEARGYQYWALGHVHEYKVWRGATTIAFPGNLQGRHIRETGPRGALLVSVADNEIETVERLYVDVLRWHALDVDVSDALTLGDAVRSVGNALATLLADTQGNAGGTLPLAVRVSLTGASPAHGQLFGLEAQLRAEVLAQAAALEAERLWIEKVRVDTTPHDIASQVAARADAVADLQALLGEAVHDEAFLEGLRRDLMLLVGKVPLEVIEALPQLQEIQAGRLSGLIEHTAPSLIAHISKLD